MFPKTHLNNKTPKFKTFEFLYAYISSGEHI